MSKFTEQQIEDLSDQIESEGLAHALTDYDTYLKESLGQNPEFNKLVDDAKKAYVKLDKFIEKIGAYK